MARFLVLLYVVVAIMHRVVLGGVAVVKLGPSIPLAGQVSQSLGPDARGTLPIVGKDYSLATHYFDNDAWVVALVSPLKDGFNASVLIMEKRGGTYTAVLGPASAFTNDQVQSLPVDVANFVATHVGVYEPLPSQ